MPTEKEYDKRKEDHDKRELSNIESYDRSLVTLTTFIFGFSLLATGYITANNISICYTEFLIVSWISLLLAIILYIVNFWVGGRSLNTDLERAEQCWNDGDHSVFDKKENWTTWCNWNNRIVGILYIIALISIVSFLIKNLV